MTIEKILMMLNAIFIIVAVIIIFVGLGIIILNSQDKKQKKYGIYLVILGVIAFGIAVLNTTPKPITVNITGA